MYPFTFKVEFYEESDHVVLTECGVLFADTYTDAVRILEKRYIDIICIHHLFGMEADDVVILSEDAMKEIEEQH